MEISYCGKDCSDCLDKAEVGCPGCKNGPGKSSDTLCEIADCCKGRFKDACAECASNASCTLLSGRERMVQKWNRRRTVERTETSGTTDSAYAGSAAYAYSGQKRSRDGHDATLVRKSLLAIFWLFLVGGFGNVLSNENVFGLVPGVLVIGSIINIGANIARAVIMIRLGAEERAYKVAGICTLVATGLSLLASICTTVFAVAMVVAGGLTGAIGVILGVLLLLAALVLEVVGGYQFFVACARIVELRDPALSDRWSVMSKLFFAVLGGLVVIIFFVFAMPVFGLLLAFLYILGALAFGVCEYVFLYQTANRFRE